MTITKDILTQQVARQCNMMIGDAKCCVEAFIKAVSDNVKKGNKVVLSNFGTFCIKNRAPRTGRNPHTGEAVPIPARKIVSFKPSKALQFESEE